MLTPNNGEVTIPLAGIGDGQAHFYQVKADDGTTVHFFVIKSKDGVYRAAVDACDVCFKEGKGYLRMATSWSAIIAIRNSPPPASTMSRVAAIPPRWNGSSAAIRW